MNFRTRPHFEDRQIVQYNDESINLSGTTIISPTVLDFTGTTSGQSTVNINGLVGYLNEGREYGFKVEPPLLKLSGTTGYTTVDVTGYFLTSVDSVGNVGWSSFSGITDTYVTGGTLNGSYQLILDWNNGSSASPIDLSALSDSTYWTSGSSGNYSVKVVNDSTVDATGNYALASGINTLASGYGSTASGFGSLASGSLSTASGYITTASGGYSHSEGNLTSATGNSSHAEGNLTRAFGTASHAEGKQTTASGPVSHSEGNLTTASGYYSHAEGTETIASGYAAHSEGYQTTASGDISHAQGNRTLATGNTSHAEGRTTLAAGQYSHAEGQSTRAYGSASHTEGIGTKTFGPGSHAEGSSTMAYGGASHAEGIATTASGNTSHAEGQDTMASGDVSHAEGNLTTASGYAAHSEGSTTTASGDYSHAGGFNSTASGVSSFIHSTNSTVTGDRSVILGGQNITGTTNDTVYVPNLTVREDHILHSDTTLEVTDIPSSFEDTFKGSYTEFNWTGLTTQIISNSNPEGYSSFLLGNLSNFPTTNEYGFLSYFGSGYTRTGTPTTGTDFYRDKVVLKGSDDTNGVIFSLSKGENGTMWWEINDESVMILNEDKLGVGLGTDGTELPTATLQVGSTGLTGSIRYVDGNQSEGKLVTSDNNGNMTWNNTYLFTQTQWSDTVTTPVTVNDGTSVNGCAFFINNQYVTGGTLEYDKYEVITGGTVTATAQQGHIIIPYSGQPYENQFLSHSIRVNFNIANGPTAIVGLELRRAIDDSVIGAPIPLTRNQDETGIQQAFLTYTAGATDPFVTDGFYLALRNDSGSNIDIGTGSIGILINTRYQLPTVFSGY